MNQNKPVLMYAVYGSNVDLYYKPLKTNIQNPQLANFEIVIATTSLYENLVKEYFCDFIDRIKVIIFDHGAYGGKEKLLRFYAVDQLNAPYYFIKDSDSIISDQEISIMAYAMANHAYNAMIIRNHPLHVAPILAGMFGFSDRLKYLMVNEVKNALNSDSYRDTYNYDQIWLAYDIYPQIVRSTLVFSSSFYLKGEKLVRISFNDQEYIGKPEIDVEVDYDLPFLPSNSTMFSIPFFQHLPKAIKKLIYGRVRPTFFLSAIYRKIGLCF